MAQPTRGPVVVTTETTGDGTGTVSRTPHEYADACKAAQERCDAKSKKKK